MSKAKCIMVQGTMSGASVLNLAINALVFMTVQY